METSTEVDMVEEVSVVAEGDERLVSKTAGPIGALYFLPQHKHDQANSSATGWRPVSRTRSGDALPRAGASCPTFTPRPPWSLPSLLLVRRTATNRSR